MHHRELMSDVELMMALNDLFDSHEQSCGSRVRSVSYLPQPDSTGCNWQIEVIDHGMNVAQDYDVLADHLIAQMRYRANLVH